MIITVILLFIVLLAGYYDLTSFKIPNWLTLSTLISGLLVALITELGIMNALSGMLIGFIVTYIIYIFKGIGAGDVKLFTAVGAWLGIISTVKLLVLSFIFGGIISIIFLGWFALKKILNKRIAYSSPLLRETISPAPLFKFGIIKAHQFPFMLAVVPAMFVVLFYSVI